jgi:hypothetical protein
LSPSAAYPYNTVEHGQDFCKKRKKARKIPACKRGLEKFICNEKIQMLRKADIWKKSNMR